MDLEKVLKQRIEELSAIGSDPAGGMTRLTLYRFVVGSTKVCAKPN